MTEYFGSETVVIDGDVRSVADVLDHDEFEVLYPVVSQEHRTAMRSTPARARFGGGVMKVASIRVPSQELTSTRERDCRERQFKDN